MYNWLLTGGVEVDWAIAIAAFIILMAVAVLIGYIYGFDHGFADGRPDPRPKHFNCRCSIEPFQEGGEDSSV